MRLPSLARFLSVTFCVALLFVFLACGRSSLEIETTEGGTTPPGTCNASTCPTGCCDSTGTCRTGSDVRACGTSGRTCTDCVGNGFQFCDGRGSCGRNVTTCSAATCPTGCCSSSGGGAAVCLQGNDAFACGRGGQTCDDCASEGRSCDTIARVCSAARCDSTNCDGCCVGDQCLPGTAGTACGTNGGRCTSCTSTGQTCAPTGGGGGVCQGTPTCGPANCGGCCQGTTCVAGSDALACGRQGQACSNCTATGRICVPPGQPNERSCQVPPPCTAATCPSGCCAGDVCVFPPTDLACGKGGAACGACAPTDTCTAGTCTPRPACGPANCADGCCVGNICVRAADQPNTACGLGGAACQNCAASQRACRAGVCRCEPGSCTGCCGAGETCAVGTQNTSCGMNGANCQDCTAGGTVCQGRACQPRCGPATCPNGCCQADNSCALGFATNACGSGGAACANCGAQACNTAANPRVCTAAGSCPANYPGCAPAATTPITPSLQGLCDDAAELDAIEAACIGGPESASCIAAFAALQATNAACATCLAPFNVPFEELSGLFRCAAPFVSAACNHNTACATDCGNVSCNNCPAGQEATCRNNANDVGGQCRALVVQSACAFPALNPGQLCDPNVGFGTWLRNAGDHFCGNGP